MLIKASMQYIFLVTRLEEATMTGEVCEGSAEISSNTPPKWPNSSEAAPR